MHVVLDRLARRFLGRLEQRPDIDVEADIGEGGGDHLGAAVVPVLAELHHQHARPAALVAGEGLDLALDAAIALVALVERAIDAGDRADRGAVAGEDRSSASEISPTVARARAASIAQLQQIALPAPRRVASARRALP